MIGAGWIGAEVAGVAAAAGRRRRGGRGERRARSPAALGADRRGADRPLVRRRGRPAADRRARRRGRHQRRAASRTASWSPPTSCSPRWARGRPPTGWPGRSPASRTARCGSTSTTRVVGAPRSVRAVGDVALRRSPRHGWVPGGHWDGALRGPAGARRGPAGHAATTAVADVAPYVFSTQLGPRARAVRAARTRTTRWSCAATRRGDGWAALWFRRGSDEVARDPHGRPPARRRRRPAAVHRRRGCPGSTARCARRPRAAALRDGRRLDLSAQCAKCRVPVR